MEWSGQGDQNAFSHIVSRHGKYVVRVAARIVGNVESAEEISQELFIKIWKNAESYISSRSKFSTWLYRILLNTCIDFVRKRKCEALPDAFDFIDEAENPEEQVSRKEWEAMLAVAVDRIPLQQREAIALVYGEEKTGTEAARLMGLSRKKVERLLTSGRSRLRKEMLGMRSKWNRRSS
ncbi:sigma-70 family RNA polymerase sigma factor [Asaia prunellae]|uniref:sigma-70 family RNA polymerase sigma factor n=1 Tax=Asaia prunellae TaxID=610245 RepID=UPI00131F232E|nr:sigma-70 family RNA polymerase sigma factor [Asaia prunellae]